MRRRVPVGEQPLPHDQNRYRGQVPCHRSMDFRPCQARETIQAPSERGLRRKHLRRTRKSLAGRYYQLLSRHAAIGTYLVRIKKTDTSECWYDNGELQSRNRLFTSSRAWAPQIRRLWEGLWVETKAPSVRWPWDVRATEAVFEFLRDTRVGCMVTTSPRGEEGGGSETKGEEGGPGPP